jgi:hypothetical protein
VPAPVASDPPALLPPSEQPSKPAVTEVINEADRELGLADAAMNAGDTEAVVPHLMRAAELGSARAKYNLGVIASAQGENNLAYLMFVDATRRAPEYLPPVVELARMYTEGRGVGLDAKKGLAMMRFAAEWAKETGLMAIAEYNVGMLYKRGIGARRSASLARVHLERSRELGLEAASEQLADLGSAKPPKRAAPPTPSWSRATYVRRHTVAHLADDHWVEGQAEDCLSIAEASNGSTRVELSLVFDNDHGCELSGRAEEDAAHRLIVTSDDFADCRVVLEMTDDYVRVVQHSAGDCVADMCGARGFLLGQTLPLSARKRVGSACSKR